MEKDINNFKKEFEETKEEHTLFYQDLVITISYNVEETNPYILTLEYIDRIVDFSFENIDDLLLGKVFNKLSLTDIWPIVVE